MTDTDTTAAERLDCDVERIEAFQTAERLYTLAEHYRRLSVSGRDHAEERRLRFVAREVIRTLVEEWV